MYKITFPLTDQVLHLFTTEYLLTVVANYLTAYLGGKVDPREIEVHARPVGYKGPTYLTWPDKDSVVATIEFV
jgi:hypothetical protein